MTKHFPNSLRPTGQSRLVNRRAFITGMTAVSALGAAAHVAGQSTTPFASPAATPGASPVASPIGTPTPSAIPDHRITIIEDPVTYGSPTTGGTIRQYIGGSGLTDGNPLRQTQDVLLLSSVFDGLIRIDPDTMEPTPGLATDWEYAADGLTLTFTLRSGVTWHNDTPFSANDVRFSLLAWRDDYDSAFWGMFGLVDDVVVVSDTSVQVVFSAPDGAFLYNAGTLPIVSSDQYTALWNERPEGERSISRDDQSPANWNGTGAWKIGDVSETRVTLQRNDQWWNGKAHVDTLELLVEDDGSARIDGWKNGDVDVLQIRATDLDEIWDEEGSLFARRSASAMFAAFNFANPANPTSTMMMDTSLRTALDLIIDRERYAREVFHSFIDERAAGTSAQPWLHDSDLRTPEQNIDAAKEALAIGGWADVDGDGLLEDGYGNKLDLWLIVRTDERPELLALIDLIGDDFGKVGAKLTVQRLDPQAFDERWSVNRDYDMSAWTVVNYPTFNEFDLYGSQWDIRSNTAGWNPGGYNNAAVDAAITQFFAALEPADVKQAVADIQVGTNDDLFGLWFGFPYDLVLVRPDVQGYRPNIFLSTLGAETWWKGRGEPEVEGTPAATPVPATPVASPGATPVGTTGATSQN